MDKIAAVAGKTALLGDGHRGVHKHHIDVCRNKQLCVYNVLAVIKQNLLHTAVYKGLQVLCLG